jgi:hypothetical protein
MATKRKKKKTESDRLHDPDVRNALIAGDVPPQAVSDGLGRRKEQGAIRKDSHGTEADHKRVGRNEQPSQTPYAFPDRDPVEKMGEF